MMPATLLAILLRVQDPTSTVEALKEPAPSGVAEALRKELTPAGTRVLQSGKPLLDLWLRSVVPTAEPRSGRGIRYGTLVPGAFLGAVQVSDGAADFKGQKVPAGLYTLRYAVQPDDGDHLDVTETRDFLLLCEAAADRTPGTLDAKALEKLSARINGRKHPAVLSLTAATTGAAPRVATLKSPERTVLEVDVPTPAGKPLRLAIVVAGKAGE